MVSGEKPSEEICTTKKWFQDCCYWNRNRGSSGECLPKGKKLHLTILGFMLDENVLRNAKIN